MNLPDYDEIARLRLRLAEVELQRDAYRAAAEKVVLDLIREVLAKEDKPRMHGLDIPDPHSFRYGVPADNANAEKHPADEWLSMGNDKLLERIKKLEASAWHEHTRINSNRDNIDHLIRRVETLEEDGNIVDGIIDRVSQRVDKEQDRVSAIRDYQNNRIQHLLCRIEKLEASRHA